MELESVISLADVIDPTTLSGDIVRFGATIELADENTDDESTFQIVGTYEADIEKGLLSVTSPTARALIGKSLGDSVEVTTPGGSKSYEIIKVDYK
jgi:transcription elongation factor GreA